MNIAKFTEMARKLGMLLMMLGIVMSSVSVVLAFFNQTVGGIFVWALIAVAGYMLREILPKPSGV